MPFKIVLINPEIAPNTGNIARLSIATGSELHLVKPLGFSLDDRYMKRAGLDYWPQVKLFVHDSLDALSSLLVPPFYAFSARADKNFYDIQFSGGEWLIFGAETNGLPAELLASIKDRLYRIPMAEQSRCLNLSNSVAVVVYEGIRQLGI